MRKGIYLIAFLFFSFITLLQCSDSTSSKSGMGTLAISLTDAPAAYDSVIIVFSEISAHIDSQWVHVKQEPVRVNLLDWSNGETFLLGSVDVPAGKYTQVRIKIDSAFIGVKGQVHELVVPSGSKTGIKLGPQFTINEGSTYELVLDFDACRSVVVNGPKRNPKGYKLKPRIRLIANAVSGSISGIVTNPAASPVAHAIVNADTITSTFVDTTNGFFKLAFLPDSVYTIAVEDTIGKDYLKESVNVMAGQNYDLGTITLD